MQRLPVNTLVVLHDRNYPYKAKFTPYWQMNEKGLFGKHYQQLELPEPNANPVQVFDIVGFTKKKQDEMVAKKQAEDRAAIEAAMKELEESENKEKAQIEAQNNSKKQEQEKAEEARKQQEAANREKEEQEKLEQQKQQKEQEELEKKRLAEEERKRQEENRLKQEKLKNIPKPAIVGDEPEAKEIKTNDIFKKVEAKPVANKPIPKQESNSFVDNSNITSVTDDEFFDDFFSDE